ncbi:MAG: FAD binding domain-containing protein [Thermodesulfobacteriota bacterium]
MLPQFSYVRPDNIEEAVKQLNQKAAAVHAGGTDLLGCLREHIIDADRVVSISSIKDLHGIRETSGGGVVIGALTTITEVSQSPVIQKKYPGLARGASEVASPQLRNQGTLGGNLCQKPRCWYYRGEFECLRKGGGICSAAQGENQFHAILGHDGICYATHPSDTAPVLVALNARVRAAGPEGSRKVPVEELHVRPAKDVTAETVLGEAEIITHVEIPEPAETLYSSYRKIRARRAWDFALAGVALALEMDGDTVKKARVVLSGAAPVPWRSREAESVITGKKLDGSTISQAANAAVADAEPLSGNAYKTDMFRGIIEEELEAARD